jgi:DNA polymerase-3 subunit gamma/tau
MSYLVLARKWRPQSFDEVVGQDHVTHTLKKAVEKERLAHAYLFSGPRGCGKTTTARLLAKVINCTGRSGGEPCNTCPSCVAVTEGRHLDMIEIDGASNRGIDEIRDLREKIGYAPSLGKSKIYIIDEVHMLTPQAFNALLKTLEEPPSHVYLVFATTEPHKVPPTILSRCQRFNFKRLELTEITGQLEKICKHEKIKHQREAIVLIGRKADGSMRDAESLLDQSFSASEGKVDLELVRRVLGLVDSRLITELIGAIGRHDGRGALEIVDRVVSAGLDLEEFFLGYLEGLRNLLVLGLDGESTLQWLDLGETERRELEEAGEPFTTADLLYLFRLASRSFRDIKLSSQPRYHLEAAVAEAAAWESSVELSHLIRKIEGSGGGGGRGGGSATRKKPAGGEKSGPVVDLEGEGDPREGSGAARIEVLPDEKLTPDGYNAGSEVSSASVESAAPSPAGEGADVNVLEKLGGREQWERFLSQVRGAKLTLGIWLMSAEVKEVRGERLILAFSSQNRFAREMIREEKNRRYIESHLERFYGTKYVVEVGEDRLPDAEQAGSEAPPAKQSDPEITRLLEETPMVGRLIEEFDGELFTDDKR